MASIAIARGAGVETETTLERLPRNAGRSLEASLFRIEHVETSNEGLGTLLGRASRSVSVGTEPLCIYGARNHKPSSGRLA